MEGEHGKPNIEFTADGLLKSAELKIMNLRPGTSKQLVWEEVRGFIKVLKKLLIKTNSGIILMIFC